jgi:hypothetical protein
MQMEEQGGRMMELCGLVVRPHQKYLRLISTQTIAVIQHLAKANARKKNRTEKS